MGRQQGQRSDQDVTRLLEDLRRGDREAGERLWPLVYEELRRLAKHQMAGEKAGLTLQPTALVHEAYLRLIGHPDDDADWESRAHFFAAAAKAMRRVLIERSRRAARLRHGGGRQRVPVDTVILATTSQEVDMIDLDRALSRLDEIDPQKAAIVTLRHLIGCSIGQTATALGLSEAKVRKDWTFARAWLHRELKRLA